MMYYMAISDEKLGRRKDCARHQGLWRSVQSAGSFAVSEKRETARQRR